MTQIDLERIGYQVISPILTNERKAVVYMTLLDADQDINEIFSRYHDISGESEPAPGTEVRNNTMCLMRNYLTRSWEGEPYALVEIARSTYPINRNLYRRSFQGDISHGSDRLERETGLMPQRYVDAVVSSVFEIAFENNVTLGKLFGEYTGRQTPDKQKKDALGAYSYTHTKQVARLALFDQLSRVNGFSIASTDMLRESTPLSTYDIIRGHLIDLNQDGLAYVDTDRCPYQVVIDKRQKDIIIALMKSLRRIQTRDESFVSTQQEKLKTDEFKQNARALLKRAGY